MCLWYTVPVQEEHCHIIQQHVYLKLAIQIFPINCLCKTQRIYADQTLFRPMHTLVRKALRCLNITKRRSLKHWFSLECMLLVSNIHLEKGCYTPIWDSKIDMEWIYVLPVGWTWQEMYLWLLPNEVRHFFGWTFTSIPSAIVKIQTRGLGVHFTKSAFVQWQVRINNCICFLNSH